MHNDVMDQHEKDANRLVARALLFAAGLCLVIITLTFVHLYDTPFNIMLRDFGISAALLVLPCIVLNLMRREGSWTKYFGIFTLISVLFILYSDFQIKAYVFPLMVLPLIVAAIYIDLKLVLVVAITIVAGVNLIDVHHDATIYDPVVFENGILRTVKQDPQILDDSVAIDITFALLIFTFAMLTRRTTNVLGNLVAAKDKILKHAYYDDLTRLPNRSLLKDRLHFAIEQAWNEQHSLALLSISIKRLDQVEHTSGLSVVDQLILDVSSRLMTVSGGGRTLAKMKDREFALLMPQISNEMEPIEIAKRIVTSLEEPFELAGQRIFLAAAVGIAISLDAAVSAETLIKNAHNAMLQVIRSGEGNYQLYNKDIQAATSKKIALEAELRKAIENEELLPYYQPKVKIINGEIKGAEALIRWHHPDRGLISPAEFIPLAEETDLIVPIDMLVLRKTCEHLKQWSTERAKPITVSVNVSYRDFIRHDLVGEVKNALGQYGIDPSLLELEITETIAMQNVKLVENALKQISDLGVRVSIDDFGTGYSSLQYLSRFKVNTLKIDQSFVRGISLIPDDAIIVSMVVAMAKQLGLDTVAEGVETEVQLDFLRDKGCDLAQGYYFGRPMPAEELTTKFLMN